MSSRPAHRPRGSRDLAGRCIRVSLAEVSKLSRATVARAVRRARVENDIAASELAAACACSRREVHNIENGRVDISVGRLRQLACALGVPVDHLLR